MLKTTSRAVISALAIIALACSAAYAAQKTSGVIKAESASKFPANGRKQVTAPDVNSSFQDVADSFIPILSTNSNCFWKANGASPATCEVAAGATDASLLTSGTLNAARLPGSATRNDTASTFSALKIFSVVPRLPLTGYVKANGVGGDPTASSTIPIADVLGLTLTGDSGSGAFLRSINPVVKQSATGGYWADGYGGATAGRFTRLNDRVLIGAADLWSGAFDNSTSGTPLTAFNYGLTYLERYSQVVNESKYGQPAALNVIRSSDNLTIPGQFPANFTGTLTSGSPIITGVTGVNWALIAVNTRISGTGIPANAWVTAFNIGSSTITLNVNATAAGAQSLAVRAGCCAIGEAFAAINDNTTVQQAVWGVYGTMVALEGAGPIANEIDLHNARSTASGITPYKGPGLTNMGASVIFALQAGGESVGLTPHSSPTDAAIFVGYNGQTFDRGIVFGYNSLTDNKAITLAKGHKIEQTYDAAGSVGSFVQFDIGVSGNSAGLYFGGTNILLRDSSGAYTHAEFDTVANAVNFIKTTPTVSGGGTVSYGVGGADANIDLALVPKGTGVVDGSTASAKFKGILSHQGSLGSFGANTLNVYYGGAEPQIYVDATLFGRINRSPMGTPTLSSCGTGSAIDSTSRSNGGKFTIGTGATGCTITFPTAYISTAFCTVSPFGAQPAAVANIPYISAQSTGAFTVSGGTASASYTYVCNGA